MRVIFAGTPEPAVPSLQKLIDSPDFDVVAVLTRPDARVGRGRSLRRSPVGELADEYGIEVLTPTTLKDDAVVARITELAPEAIPVVAYGNLVPKNLLDVPTHGWINLHFSLLPAWRGAAPVQAAIAAGDDITGASTFRIEEGLDTGPVLGTITERIAPTDTADDLLGRLAVTGAELLAASLTGLAAGAIRPEPQPTEGISHAAKIEVEDAQINWQLPAHVIDRQVRAHTPAPGAWSVLGEQRIKVGPFARVVDVVLPDDRQLAPGEIFTTKKAVFVGTGSDAVQLGQVQAPGKRMMNAADWARGANPAGEVFS